MRMPLTRQPWFGPGGTGRSGAWAPRGWQGWATTVGFTIAVLWTVFVWRPSGPIPILALLAAYAVIVLLTTERSGSTGKDSGR